MDTIKSKCGRYIVPADVDPDGTFTHYQGRWALFAGGRWLLFVGSQQCGYLEVEEAFAMSWVGSCQAYQLRKRMSAPKPTRFADADLSLWCQRYEGEPVQYVRGPGVNGFPAIVPLGFKPSLHGSEQGCRKATWNGLYSSWNLYKSNGLPPIVPNVKTDEEAIRWVVEGKLPNET